MNFEFSMHTNHSNMHEMNFTALKPTASNGMDLSKPIQFSENPFLITEDQFS